MKNSDQRWHTNKGGKGREVGSPGWAGPKPTEEDDLLALRRYVDFIVKTKDLEPFSYDATDVIKTLPMDGGTPLACGDTRFEHLMNDKCKNPSLRGQHYAKCEKEMKDDRVCGRNLGHQDACSSLESMERNRQQNRKRERAKVREREMDKRNG